MFECANPHKSWMHSMNMCTLGTPMGRWETESGEPLETHEVATVVFTVANNRTRPCFQHDKRQGSTLKVVLWLCMDTVEWVPAQVHVHTHVRAHMHRHTCKCTHAHTKICFSNKEKLWEQHRLSIRNHGDQNKATQYHFSNEKQKYSACFI